MDTFAPLALPLSLFYMRAHTQTSPRTQKEAKQRKTKQHTLHLYKGKMNTSIDVTATQIPSCV